MGNDDSPDEKVKAYYIFHKKIECFFKMGYDPLSKNEYGEIKKFYIINNNFIDIWKNNSGYNIAKNSLDTINIDQNYFNNIEKMCDNLNNQKLLKNALLDYNLKMDNNNKFTKGILSLKDFDYLFDEKTYELFNLENGTKIEGIIYNKMIILIFKDLFLMRFLYYGQFQNNFLLIQLTSDFTKNTKDFNSFKEYLETQKSDDIIILFNNINIVMQKEIVIKLKNGI